METIFLNFIFSSALTMVPFVFFLITIIGAGYLYRAERISGAQRRKLFIRFAFAVISFRIAFAGVMSGLQYYAWSLDPMGKLLLPPTQSITVIARYVWTHFWINPLIVLGLGLLVFLLLNILQKKNERFFDAGEVELGTLLAVAVGWPNFVLFFPLAFLFVVVLSIIRGIFFKESFTTLGWPFLAASIIALFFGMRALTAMQLTAWKI